MLVRLLITFFYETLSFVLVEVSICEEGYQPQGASFILLPQHHVLKNIDYKNVINNHVILLGERNLTVNKIPQHKKPTLICCSSFVINEDTDW